MNRVAWLSTVLLISCANYREGVDSSGWWEQGSFYQVEEALEWTDSNYDFSGSTAIADIPQPPGDPLNQYDNTVIFGDDLELTCAEWTESTDLPVEITGIITLHPRMYTKRSGCDPNGDDRIFPSDEKYYGSFFIQDESGGIYVLGDSKVAHFDMGDRVTIKVRSVKREFSLTMVGAHDIVKIERGPEPMFYSVSNTALDWPDVGLVKRVTGRVVTEADTFGQLEIQDDAGVVYNVSIDSELARRGMVIDMGTEVQVTGPVINGFGNVKQIIVMKVGQLCAPEGATGRLLACQ